MRRVTLFILLVSFLAVPAAACASTTVSGTLSGSTTWHAADGPFLVTGDVLIPTDSTLTVEAGTDVRLSPGKGIIVRGAINATGTQAAPIRFEAATAGAKWNSIKLDTTPTVTSFDWVEISDATIGVDAVDADATVDHARVVDSTQGVRAYSTTPRTWATSVKHSYFSRIAGAALQYYMYGANSMAGEVAFDDNAIHRSAVGVDIHHFYQPLAVRARRNAISNNTVGVAVETANSGWTIDIEDNAIELNGIGVQTYVAGANNSTFTATGNNITGNETWDWDLHNWRDYTEAAYRGDVSAVNNWWGTTSASEIDAHVNDSNDDIYRGTLTYVPFLTVPNAATAPTLDTTAPTTTITGGPTGTTRLNDATFSLGTSEPGRDAEIECRLDGAVWSDCGSSASYSALADGAHVFEARSIDASGNAGAAQTRSWTIDTTPPETQIDSGPDEYTTSTTAAFTASAPGEPTATLECAPDAAAYASCPSSYSDLSEDSHDLSVRAVDEAGNADATAATWHWTVDHSAPGPFDLLAPADQAILADPSPTVAWEPSGDAVSGTASYDVLVDGVVIASLPAGACAAQCSTAVDTPLADGPHDWTVRAVDRAGNTRGAAGRDFTIATPPTARLTANPALVLTGAVVTFGASASTDPNGSIEHFRWDLDGDGDFETDTGASATAARSYATRGLRNVSVRVTDSGGLTDTATRQVDVRLRPPPGELGVSINNGDIATNDPNVRLRVVWPDYAESALASNDGGFGPAGGTTLLPVAPELDWRLASSGPERLPKIVYVRFRGGESGRETYTDDIILDETQPALVGADLAAASTGASRLSKARADHVRLQLLAKDDNSGIAVVQVARTKAGKRRSVRLVKRTKRGARRLDRVVSVPRVGRPFYVRVLDAAGNRSKWRRVGHG